MKRPGRSPCYHLVLNIPEGRIGKFAIQHDVRPPGATFKLAGFRTALFGGHKARSVTYHHETRWHKLVEDPKGLWMTDWPIEQRQADDTIVGFRGDVLVGGLGLGYVTTALAAKSQVKRIVVVERSQEVADLVWPHLDDQVHSKTVLVVEDLFTYLKKIPVAAFRFAFYDIWQEDGETTFHTMVVPLRKLSRGKVMHVRCWNEDVMRGQLFMGLHTRLTILQTDLVDRSNDLMGLKMTKEKFLKQWTTRRNGDVWRNWSVPFFQMVATNPTKDWTSEARHYVQMYER